MPAFPQGHQPPDEPIMPSPLGPGFGLAAMLATRSLTTVRSEQAATGWIRGLSLSDIMLGLEASPSASYLFNDSRVSRSDAASHGPLENVRWACRINGPIEPRDRQAICAAVARGDDPLDFEIRADLWLKVQPSGVTFSTTDDQAVGAIAATLLRHHVADALRQPASSIPPPDEDVTAALLDREGLSLRGLETQIFPGFLDVGIAGVASESNPATRSVIYDRITGAWHTD